MSLHTFYTERFQITFKSNRAGNILLLETSSVIRQLFYFSLTEKLNLVSILLVLRRQSMLNAVELN